MSTPVDPGELAAVLTSIEARRVLAGIAYDALPTRRDTIYGPRDLYQNAVNALLGFERQMRELAANPRLVKRSRPPKGGG